MTYLTHESFLEKVEASGSKYWREGKNYRWQYMSAVIDILKEICPIKYARLIMRYTNVVDMKRV